MLAVVAREPFSLLVDESPDVEASDQLSDLSDVDEGAERVCLF
jgi:hypothetical protein